MILLGAGFTQETASDGRIMVYACERQTIAGQPYRYQYADIIIGWHTPTFAEASVINAPLWRKYLNSLQNPKGTK